MTGTGGVACNSISKTSPARSIFMTDAGHTWSAVLRAWKWLTRHGRGALVRGMSRRLKVVETVSLGEKRFISILQVDGEQFLVGGSASNIVLLARLDAKPEAPGAGSFESVLSSLESGHGEGEENRRDRIEVMQ